MSHESDLFEAMNVLYEQTKKTVYPATYFLEMLHKDGAVETVKHLVLSKDVPTGFAKMYYAKMLSLTVEALILDKKWDALFRDGILDEEVRAAARKRLQDYGYEVK